MAQDQASMLEAMRSMLKEEMGKFKNEFKSEMVKIIKRLEDLEVRMEGIHGRRRSNRAQESGATPSKCTPRPRCQDGGTNLCSFSKGAPQQRCSFSWPIRHVQEGRSSSTPSQIEAMEDLEEISQNFGNGTSISYENNCENERKEEMEVEGRREKSEEEIEKENEGKEKSGEFQVGKGELEVKGEEERIPKLATNPLFEELTNDYFSCANPLFIFYCVGAQEEGGPSRIGEEAHEQTIKEEVSSTLSNYLEYGNNSFKFMDGYGIEMHAHNHDFYKDPFLDFCMLPLRNHHDLEKALFGSHALKRMKNERFSFHFHDFENISNANVPNKFNNLCLMVNDYGMFVLFPLITYDYDYLVMDLNNPNFIFDPGISFGSCIVFFMFLIWRGEKFFFVGF